jgi:hypothetical protein
LSFYRFEVNEALTGTVALTLLLLFTLEVAVVLLSEHAVARDVVAYFLQQESGNASASSLLNFLH